MRKYRVNVHKPGTVPAEGRARKYRASGTGGGWNWGGFFRTLLWILLALLLAYLLSLLFRNCSRTSWAPGTGGVGGPGRGAVPAPTRPAFPGGGWRTPRDGGGIIDPGIGDFPYPDDGLYPGPGDILPGPDDNRIAPPPSDGGVPDPDQHKYVSPDRLNVILRSEGADIVGQWARKFKSLYPDPEHYVNYFNERTHMLQITVPEAEREAIKRGLNARMPEFDFLVFDNDVIRRDQVRTFPSLGRLFLRLTDRNWYLGAVQAVEAWDIEQGSPDVTVAVVDNFFDLSHPMLEGKEVYPYSVSRNNDDLSVRFRNNGDAHGTHVAATAAGSPVEDRAVCGIAPGCRLMPVMIGTEGSDFLDIMSTLDGIMYAIYAGADVVNISAGLAFTKQIRRLPVEEQRRTIRSFGKTEEMVWNYVYDAAEKHNTVIVWAAGNDDILSGLDPSKRNDATIRVSAVNHRLRKSGFSNYGVFGPEEYYSTVSAPGEDIYNALPGDKYGFMSGTSMAAPIVTGAVALMKSLDRTLTTEEIITILRQTGKPVGEDIGPLIQIKDALEAVRDGFLNYDEVIDDPESIVGLWKSTTPLFSTVSNAPIILYMRFTSSTSGQLIVHENDSGHEFTAPLTVSITSSGIEIRQLSIASNPSYSPGYSKYYYHCSPDDRRSVQCLASLQESGYPQSVVFNLRKIK